MNISVIWWLVLVLIIAEFGAVVWVRRDRYPRFRFSLWAPAIYAAMITGDLLLGVLLAAVLGGGTAEAVAQTNGLLAWAVVAALVAGALALLTLFFRWVVHTEIREPADDEKHPPAPDQEQL